MIATDVDYDSLQALLESSDPDMLQLAFTLVKSLGLPSFDEHFITYISNSTQKLHLCQEFDLSNKISTIHLDHYFVRNGPPLHQFQQLQKLYINQKTWHPLQINFAKLNALKYLSFEGSHMKYLPRSLKHLSHLEALNLEYNRIKRRWYTLKDLIHLKYLNIAHNDLRHLPPYINQLRELRELNLSNNRIQALPEYWSRFQHLEILHLSKNKLLKVPTALHRLTKLKVLDLSYNPIRRLPRSFFLLKNLEQLILIKTPLIKNKSQMNKLKAALPNTEIILRQMEINN